MLILLSILGEQAWLSSRDRVHAKERCFRDTQLQCCPLIEAQLPLCLLGSWQEPQPTTESSHSPPGSPLVEEKASQMLPIPTACREVFDVLQGTSISLTPPALGTHPAFLTLGAPVGHGGAPCTAPRLQQDQNCLWGWMIPFWADRPSLLAMGSFPN